MKRRVLGKDGVVVVGGRRISLCSAERQETVSDVMEH